MQHRDFNNDAELVRLLHQGDKAAFQLFYERHFIPIFHFAKKFVVDQQAAEDITTECFLKLWERLAGFPSVAAMKSFLYVSTKNACLNHLRSEQRKDLREQQLEYFLQIGPDSMPFDLQLQSEIYQQIFTEIEKLSPQLKLIFRLAYIEGLSNEEIALQLGINNQSVRNDKSRALKQIRLAMMDKGIYGLFVIWVMMQVKAVSY